MMGPIRRLKAALHPMRVPLLPRLGLVVPPRLSVLLLPLLLLAGAGGCERPSSSTSQIPKMRVVATVYPLADVAREVGGPFVDASWIVEGGQSLTGVQSSEELRNRLSNADFVISASPSTEPWANTGNISDPYQRQRMI